MPKVNIGDRVRSISDDDSKGFTGTVVALNKYDTAQVEMEAAFKYGYASDGAENTWGIPVGELEVVEQASKEQTNDTELQALHVIIPAFIALDDPTTRQRIIDYLTARFY